MTRNIIMGGGGRNIIMGGGGFTRVQNRAELSSGPGGMRGVCHV